EKNALKEWSESLGYLTAVVQDAQMQACISDPNITPQQLESLVISVCGKNLGEMGMNFVRELVHNGRLSVLPQIRELYETMKAEEGGMLDAQVTSAYPLSKAQLKDLVEVLEGKFKKKIEATADVDPELIGGVRVVIGDDVIDASVRGKLQAMAFALTR
ncbi:MAG TPA: F0F1 ATP synthase subunit delta, partial [Burkholderiales bacterium]|nr:F0F1 ATP synthase subunit delta [Burkholderiales bacterium]